MSRIIKLSSRRGDISGLERFVVRPLRVDAAQELARKAKERNDPISAARRQAELIEAEAINAAAEIRKKAWDEGYAEACAAARTEHQSLLDEARNAIEQCEREEEEYWRDIEPELVRLAVEIAEKIIRNELSTKPEIVLDVARSSIRQVRQRESLRMRVNPADLEMAKTHRTELLETADGVRHLEVVDDRRVDRGGVVIESDDGVLDSRVKTQLSEVEKALSEAASESSGHEE